MRGTRKEFKKWDYEQDTDAFEHGSGQHQTGGNNHTRARLMILSTGFVDHWRSQIFHALAGASWSAVTALRRTDVEHTITIDVMRIGQGTDRILRGGACLAVLVIQLVIALVLAPILTILVLVFIAAASMLLMSLMRKAWKLGQCLTRAGRDVHSVMGQFFSGLKLAKTHSSEQKYVEQFDVKLADVRHQIVEFTREQSTSRLIFQSITGLMACVIVVIGVFVFATPA